MNRDSYEIKFLIKTFQAQTASLGSHAPTLSSLSTPQGCPLPLSKRRERTAIQMTRLFAPGQADGTLEHFPGPRSGLRQSRETLQGWLPWA